jgi:ABC-type sugar transport system permease subunit
LETLSEEYVDAMKIDGANWWRTLFNLYIPHLRGILLFYATLIIINMLSWVFNYVYVMTGGANNTMAFEMYVYRQLFLYSNKWTGSAAAVIVSVVVFALILVQMQSRLGLAEEDAE